MSNPKIAIPVTLKTMDSWLDYIESCGYNCVQKDVNSGWRDYYTDAPGYSMSTPAATLQSPPCTKRRYAYIYIRLPRKIT